MTAWSKMVGEGRKPGWSGRKRKNGVMGKAVVKTVQATPEESMRFERAPQIGA